MNNPTHHVSGPFDVKVTHQDDSSGDPLLNRMTLDKQYHGDLEATGIGQMLTAGTDVKGSGAYVAIEKVTGTLEGKKGTFILQHAGMLEDLLPEGRAAWRGGMARLAACPNVVSKLSGLGTFIHRNDPAHVSEVLTETVTIFGAERCLFGSNFPIEKLWTSYRELVDAYLAATAHLRADQRDAILRTTASRVYRLET